MNSKNSICQVSLTQESQKKFFICNWEIKILANLLFPIKKHDWDFSQLLNVLDPDLERGKKCCQLKVTSTSFDKKIKWSWEIKILSNLLVPIKKHHWDLSQLLNVFDSNWAAREKCCTLKIAPASFAKKQKLFNFSWEIKFLLIYWYLL